MPSIASVLLLPENQAESLGHQRQTHTAQSGASGHGGIAHPRSHQGYGSLTESVVEPEPASESVDDPHDVVNRSSTSPSSNAAQPSQQLGPSQQHYAMGAQLGPHRKAHPVHVGTTYPPPDVLHLLPK